MTDNIVTRLRDIASLRGPMAGNVIPFTCNAAAGEIELLNEVIELLIDELRQNGGYEAYTPTMVRQEFIDKAVER